MRILRYSAEGAGASWGVLDGSRVERLQASPLAGELRRSGERHELEAVTLLAPTKPTKIIGVGRNYPAHAAEHNAPVPPEPLIFLKPPSSVIGPGQAIELPALSGQVEHEGELAVVIGRPGRRIPEAAALEHVAGYTAANDVTARDLQRGDPQWTRGKGFDTFCALGPWIETALDLEGARLTCAVNDELRQQGSPAEMVFSVPRLVAFISEVMTLETGDVILTGTPAGVGPLAPGDVVTVVIEGLGALTNPVVSA